MLSYYRTNGIIGGRGGPGKAVVTERPVYYIRWMPAALIPKDEVLDRLTAAFREHGYEGATLARLSEATGLVRASLYHYFPDGKEGMARAVLDRAGEAMRRDVLAPLQSPGTPRERLTAMARGLDAFYRGGELPCLLGLFSAGAGRTPMERAITAALEEWVRAVASCVAEAGVEPRAARERAEDALAAVQGALVLARARGSTAPFARLVAGLPDRLLQDVRLA